MVLREGRMVEKMKKGDMQEEEIVGDEMGMKQQRKEE